MYSRTKNSLILLSVLAAAHLGCANNVEVTKLSFQGVDNGQLNFLIELDKDIEASFPNYLITFRYLVLDAAHSPTSIPMSGENLAPADKKEFDFILAELKREDSVRVFECDRYMNENDSDRHFAVGKGVFRRVGSSSSPPFLYKVVMPMRVRPLIGSPEFLFSRGERYLLCMQVEGRVPTFGAPFAVDRTVESNVLGVGVEVR